MSTLDIPPPNEQKDFELTPMGEKTASENPEAELLDQGVLSVPNSPKIPAEFKTGQAVWHSPDGDVPVKIISYLGRALDDQIYVEAEGRDDGVPLAEIEYVSDSAKSPEPNEPATTPDMAPLAEIISAPASGEVAKAESLDFTALSPEQALAKLWSQVREFQIREKSLAQWQEDIKKQGNIKYNPREYWDFSAGINSIIGKLVVAEDEPTAEVFSGIAADLVELNTKAEAAEQAIKTMAGTDDEAIAKPIVEVAGAEPSVEGEVWLTLAFPAAEKPIAEKKSSRWQGAWERTENFFKQKRSGKILVGIATLGSRVAGTLLGVKILMEGAVLGLGALRAKVKGEKDVWQKALANSSTDLGRYLYGGVSIFGKEIIKGDVTERRTQLNQEIEDIFKEYEAKNLKETIKLEDIKEGKDELMKKFLELDKTIKGATYLNNEEKTAYRSQLARTIWEYRKKSVVEKESLRQNVKQETEDYVHNKALAYVVTKDAVNLGLAATGAGFMRAAGYAGFTALGRLTQAHREYTYSGAKPKLSLDQLGQGTGKVTIGAAKAGYMIKDVTWNAAGETLNALALRGRKKKLMTREVVDDEGNPEVDEKGFKKYQTYYSREFLGKGTVKDFATAAGSVGTAVGLASLIGNEKFGQGLDDWIEKTGNNWSERGLAMFTDNFVENFNHYKYSITHPGETIEKTWQAVFGSGQSAPIESEIPAEELEIPAELLANKSTGVSLEDQYIQKEHPGVLKEGYSSEITAEITPEKIDSIKQAIEQGKLDSSLVKIYWSSHVIDAAQPPTIEDINKFSELTTVEKGGSYWSTFMKQFKADPASFGYEGDLADTKAVSAYGKNIMANYAFRQGLVIKNADGSLTDTRIKNPNARIIWQFDKEQGLDRLEYAPDKTGAKLETYQHTEFNQPKTEIDLAGEPAETASQAILETSDIAKDNVTYTEVDLAEQFRGAKSFDHKIRVFAGDSIGSSGQGDGLIDQLRFTDDDGDELLTIELPVGSPASSKDLASDIYQRTQAFDRSLTDLQAEMPQTSKALTLTEQVKIGRLVVPTDAWFKDGAVHEGEWCEKLNKLDSIFASHKEYLADNELTVYIGQKVDQIDVTTANNLFHQGQKLRGQLGFRQVDYGVVQDYSDHGKIIEFSAGSRGVEYRLFDQSGRPHISELTGQEIRVPVGDVKTFDQETIDQYRTLAEKRLSSELNEYNHLKARVGNTSITKNILRLTCAQTTDTEIAEMLLPADRGRAREIYDYLVQKIGGGNEQALDNLGTKTVAEALSDGTAGERPLTASPTGEATLSPEVLSAEAETGSRLEVPVKDGKVTLEYTNQGFDVAIDANTKLGRIDLIEKGILNNDFMVNLYHNTGGAMGMKVDKVEMEARVLSVYLEAHQNLLSQGNAPAAERLAKMVTKQIDLFDKTYGVNIFNRAKIESILSAGAKV